MPAVKFLINREDVEMVTDRDHAGSNHVYLWLKDGRWSRVLWMGFLRREDIMKDAYPHSAGRFVKMCALSVSRYSGSMSRPWRILHPTEFVVAFLVPYNTCEWGAYAMIDERGWPIVRGGSVPRIRERAAA